MPRAKDRDFSVYVRSIERRLGKLKRAVEDLDNGDVDAVARALFSARYIEVRLGDLIEELVAAGPSGADELV